MMIKKAILATLWVCLSPLPLAAAPASIVQSVTYDGETVTMRLDREDLRGSNFELWSQNAAGGYDVVAPVSERSYLGSVDEYPGAVACGIQLDNDDFKGAIYFDRGATWFTLGTGVIETRGLNYNNFTSYSYPAWSSVQAGQGGSTMYAFDLGVDVDHNYFTTAGSSVATALEGIEYSVAVVRAIYMRDTLTRPYLGRVIIRATLANDPYTGLTQGNYLDAVRNEWNNNQGTADRDVVAGVSPSKIGGGLAWVGVVGTSSAYSVSQSGGSGQFDVVFRHELGHNWNCGHYVGGSPEGTGLMGGNAAGRFSGPEAYQVISHRDAKVSAGILDNEGTYTAIELPPYASLDKAEFVQGVTGPLVIDVQANDHDANGQTFSLTSFDSSSAQGGTISQQGQDLVYIAPGSFLGSDSFTYEITDSAGRPATGAVVVQVGPDDRLRMYLPLDETAGTSAADSSVFANSGSFSGGDFDTTSAAGVFGNAPLLDGVDDSISVGGIQLDSDTVTLTAWIKPGATQNAWSGIIFDRSGGAAGLNIGTGTELRYHWNDGNWGWNSGLSPAADTWTFVALVVEPTQATIYMNDGGGFTSATNSVAHSPATFSTTYIGRDPNHGSRHFNGAIDEARIYSVAMSQAELQTLFDGGGAEAPSPFEGATDVKLPGVSWASAGGAISNEVYLGVDSGVVAVATTASPEYQGATTDSEWVFDLLPNTTYFWRVDSVKASTTVAGTVWSFTTGSTVNEHALVAYWKGDEGSGTSTADSSVNSSTGTLNGAGWGTGFDGGAISFDGVDDSVTFGTGPSLGGKTDFTLAAWVQTTATSDGVILQQRNGGFNGQYQLRVLGDGSPHFYVYGNSAEQFSFNTGGTVTVNDGQWHHVVAVRDGDNGHIYVDGVLVASASGTVRDLNAGIAVGMGRDIRDNIRPFGGLIDEAKIYSIAKSSQEVADSYNAYVGGANPPTWNSNPVSEVDAFKDGSYNATLVDDATDLDGNALIFSKVSGPAWLNVAPDGALSGTPMIGDLGTNNWTVDVTDGFSSPVQETLTVEVTDSIAVDNFSFELPGTSKQTNWESVPGWSSDSVAADSGVETGQGATDGSWTGFLAFSDPSVWNLTSHVIAPGDSFILKGDAKITGAGANSLRFTLYYDDGGNRVTVATLDAPITGAFQEFELTFNAVDIPASIGKNLGIELDNVSAGWVGFDNLRLTRVDLPNTAPTWNSSPVTETDATDGVGYGSTLVDDTTDGEGHPLTYSKVSGPAWLSVATDGSLIGAPNIGDVGPNSWTVDVSDGIATPVQVTLNIEVLPEPNTPPVWTNSPVNEAAAIEGVGYASTLADDATDADTDPLSFSKVSGPAWLSVATDGTLSGNPGNGDVGPNSWTVDVSDSLAAPVQITLNIEVQADNDGDGDPDVTDPDDDNDNIPDSWEQANGLDSLVDDAGDDLDGDGFTNSDEYTADTDPTDPASKLEVVIELEAGTGDRVVRFMTSAVREYVIEHRSDLATGSWVDLAPAVAGTGGELSITLPVAGARHFYRLRVRLP